VRDREFHVTVAGSGDSTFVSVRGDVDFASSGKLRRVLGAVQASSHNDRSTGHVVIDLSRVTLLDASGLGVLLEALRSADRLEHAVVLRDPSPSCMRVLEITRLQSAFRIDAGVSGLHARSSYQRPRGVDRPSPLTETPDSIRL
jgi:anti-anti-sigma factor